MSVFTIGWMFTEEQSQLVERMVGKGVEFLELEEMEEMEEMA